MHRLTCRLVSRAAVMMRSRLVHQRIVNSIGQQQSQGKSERMMYEGSLSKEMMDAIEKTRQERLTKMDYALKLKGMNDVIARNKYTKIKTDVLLPKLVSWSQATGPPLLMPSFMWEKRYLMLLRVYVERGFDPSFWAIELNYNLWKQKRRLQKILLAMSLIVCSYFYTNVYFTFTRNEKGGFHLHWSTQKPDLKNETNKKLKEL